MNVVCDAKTIQDTESLRICVSRLDGTRAVHYELTSDSHVASETIGKKFRGHSGPAPGAAADRELFIGPLFCSSGTGGPDPATVEL